MEVITADDVTPRERGMLRRLAQCRPHDQRVLTNMIRVQAEAEGETREILADFLVFVARLLREQSAKAATLQRRLGRFLKEIKPMAIGRGKYDHLCTAARVGADAAGAALIILAGKHGSGFSVQAPAEVTMILPSMLRQMADEIEASFKKGDA